MRVQALTAETLGLMVDGNAAAAINLAIRNVVEDMTILRKHMEEKRSIAITLTFEPILREGVAREADVDVQVVTKLPPAKLGSRAVLEANTADGPALLFHALVPEDPNQGHLQDVVDDQGEVDTIGRVG